MSYTWLNAPGFDDVEGSVYPKNVDKFPVTAIPQESGPLKFTPALDAVLITMNDSAYKLEHGDLGSTLAEFIKDWQNLLENKLLKYQSYNFNKFVYWQGSAADSCVENFQTVQLPFLQQMVYAVATMVDQATQLHDALQKAQKNHPKLQDIQDQVDHWAQEQEAATTGVALPNSAEHQASTMTVGAHGHGAHGHGARARGSALAEAEDPWAADHEAWESFYDEEAGGGTNQDNLSWSRYINWQKTATKEVTSLIAAADEVPLYSDGTTYDPMQPPSDGTYSYNGTTYEYKYYWDDTGGSSFSSSTWTYSDDVYLGISTIDGPPVTPTPPPTPPPGPPDPNSGDTTGGMSGLPGVMGKPGVGSKIAEAGAMAQMGDASDAAVDPAELADEAAAMADDAAGMADDSLGDGMLPASFDGGGPDMPLQPATTGGSAVGSAGAAAGAGRGIPDLAGAMGGAKAGGMGGGMPMGGGGAPGNQAGGKAKHSNEEDKALYEEDREWTHGVIGVAPRPGNKQ
jgi:hypothetical protein